MNQAKELIGLPEQISQQVLSANLLRRKIHSSLALKPPKISPTRCKSVLNNKNSTSRLRYQSKSPFRSKSLKILQIDKENQKKSPLRPDSKQKTHKSSKSYFKSEKSTKSGLTEFCINVLKEHKTQPKPAEQGKKTALKIKTFCLVKKTKNSKSSKIGSKGKTETRSKKNDDRSASGEAKELKIKAKASLIKKKQLKSVDLNGLAGKKAKSDLVRKKKEKKTHRSKKTAMKTFDLTNNVEDLLGNHEIFKTADRFEKKKKSVKTLKKLKTNEDRPASVLLTKRKSKTPKKVKKIKPPAKPDTSTAGPSRLKLLNSFRMREKEQAAKKIQQWFRSLLKKRKETPTDCPDFDESLILKSSHRRTQTFLLRPGQFQELFQKTEESQTKVAEKLSNNVTLLSSSSFQLKRPKDLDLENINTPLVTCTFESSDSSPEGKGVQLEQKSTIIEEAKNSFQSDSLEKPVRSTSKDIQQVLQTYRCYISEEDSLHSDLEISSSLIRQFEELTSESKQDSVQSSYKIPITTPECSVNVTEILSKVIETEVALFESTIQFINNEVSVDPSAEYLKTFLQALFSELMKTEAEVLDILNTPAFVDPLAKLHILQSTNIGELVKFHELDTMIPQEICEFLQKKMGCEKIWVRKTYVQMLFDCVNQTFNLLRPFGLKGVPQPWIPHSRLLFGEGDLNRVLKRSEVLMKSWVELKGGVHVQQFQSSDLEKLQVVREESMSQLLCFDVNAEEPDWLDYEDEETQSKNDVADLILLDLFKETLDLETV